MVERARQGLVVALALLALSACEREAATVTPVPATAAAPATATPASIEPPPPAPADFEPWFVDVAAERGLDFVHVSGHDGEHYLMPEIMGGGAALADLNDDGRLDAYIVQSGWLRPRPGETPPGNRLYLQQADGRFVDGSAGSGADDRGYGMGVACGDVDGDGDTDLYVTNVGPDVLLLNEGAGRFRDGTAEAGLGDPGFGASAAFADFDGDGALDLFVTNYLAWTVNGELSCHNEMGGSDYCDPANYVAPARSSVYRNLGGGRFADVTDSSGVGAVPGTGLGLACGDFDGDGRQDVFVANDGMPNRLWHNLGGFRFEDRAQLAGCAMDNSGQAKAGMGVAAEDLDGNGFLDLLVCNLDKQTDSLFLNEGGLFSDRTQRAGLSFASRRFTRFGVGLVDFDHDGHRDLFQANGRVRRQWRRYAEDPYAEPNLLLVGVPGADGGAGADGSVGAGGASARFAELPSLDGTVRPAAQTSRAAAFGDVDDDGGVDVLVVNRDGPVQLLHNRAAGRGGAWIGFDVREASGAPALGAHVSLAVGGVARHADVRAAASYLASNDPRVHIGLGGERGTQGVSAVRVRWSDGVVEDFGDFEAGAYHPLRRGAGGK